MNVLISGGGIDSTALLFHLLETSPASDIVVAHVDYGQKAASSELASILYFATKFGLSVIRLTMDMTYSQSAIIRGEIGRCKDDNRLELRNPAIVCLVASWAATMYEHTNLFLGFHAEPVDAPFPDAKTHWLKPMQDVLDLATSRKVCLFTPFAELSRQVIFQQAIKYDTDIIEYSHTCYEPVACNKCLHCKEKAYMLALINSQH